MQLTKLATFVALSPLLLTSFALPTTDSGLEARQDVSDAFPPGAADDAHAVLAEFLPPPSRRSIGGEILPRESKPDWQGPQSMSGTRTTTYFRLKFLAIASGNLAQVLSRAIDEAISNLGHDGWIPGNSWSVRNGREVVTLTNAPGQHFTWGIAATALAEVINGLLGRHQFYEGSMDVVDEPWGLIGSIDISSSPP